MQEATYRGIPPSSFRTRLHHGRCPPDVGVTRIVAPQTKTYASATPSEIMIARPPATNPTVEHTSTTRPTPAHPSDRATVMPKAPVVTPSQEARAGHGPGIARRLDRVD